MQYKYYYCIIKPVILIIMAGMALPRNLDQTKERECNEDRKMQTGPLDPYPSKNRR